MNVDCLLRAVEAVLFASDEPVPLKKLATALGAQEKDVEEAVFILDKEYEGRSFKVQRVSEGFFLVSRPLYHDIIKKVLGGRTPSPLSKGATETLAVVAYRQPVTRQDIELVRGVNPEASIETLVEKGLIREAGRKKTLGRPKLYVTTDEFLKKASLNSLDDLPPLPQKDETPPL